MADTEHGSDNTTVEPHSHTAVEHATPHERPEDWGWHAESGKIARAGGWVSVAVLLIINVGNQTRHVENVWITGIAALLVIILLVDRHHRKNSWRG